MFRTRGIKDDQINITKLYDLKYPPVNITINGELYYSNDKLNNFDFRYRELSTVYSDDAMVRVVYSLRKESKTITLFTIRYIASMELFEFCSTHNNIPVELSLDHEYQLRNGYIYNILLGEVCVILRVFKNKNDEDILRIRIQDKIDEKNIIDNSNNNLNLSKKQEDTYNFNSSNDIYKYISIGRKNCTINIDNETVSDTHLKIRYSDNSDNFYVIDGESKTGSYLLLNEPFNYLYIKDILSFRLLESKFKIQFIHNSE